MSTKNTDSPGRHSVADHDLPWAEWVIRGGLAALAVAGMVLAAIEDKEAIGTAFVGAAVAFGLGAGFFDRVVELSTTGVKLAERRKIDREAERAAPDVAPEEREALVEESIEIFANKRLAGEPVTPGLAVKEAQLACRERDFAVQTQMAHWMLEQGWDIPQVEAHGRPGQVDLVAEKGDREAAVNIKAGLGRVGSASIHQIASLARKLEQDHSKALTPVIAVADAGLSDAAAEAANRAGVSIYSAGHADQDIMHLAGPEIT